jgi:hypothetical protein
VQSESRLDRSLWAIVLMVAVALLIANFARRPLFGGDGNAAGFGHPLTLWVTGGEADSQSRLVARQVAACWSLDGQSVNVGVLPGSMASAVVDFLRGARNAPDQMLLVTSGTLADVVHDELAARGSETRERAQQAAQLLSSAPTVSLLGSDALTLAVRANSPLVSTEGLLSLMRRRPAQPFVGVAEDAWLQGNLAALAQLAGVSGRMPFNAYRSSRLALASLIAGEAGVALAPHSSLAADIDEGRVRALAWPGGRTPRSWVALLAPHGLDAGQLATLRRQASGLCAGGTWQRLLRADGLTPARGGAQALAFVHDGLAEAVRLQLLAARIVRDN